MYLLREDLSLTGVSSKAGLDQTIIIVIVVSLILFALIIVGFAFIYFKMSKKIRTIQTDVTSQNTKDDGVNPDPNRLSSFYDEINPVEEMSVFKSEEGYATLDENTKNQSQKKMSNTYSVLQPVPAPRVAISNTGARVTYLEPVLENYLDNYSNLPLPN